MYRSESVLSSTGTKGGSAGVATTTGFNADEFSEEVFGRVVNRPHISPFTGAVVAEAVRCVLEGGSVCGNRPTLAHVVAHTVVDFAHLAFP